MSEALLFSPIYITGVSIAILLTQLFPASKSYARKVVLGGSCFSQHVASVGGAGVFAFNGLRLLACLVLVGLSIPSLSMFNGDHERERRQGMLGLDVLHDGLCATFVSPRHD